MSDARSTSTFFTAGGTLPLDATYVVRPVDEELVRAALSGEYCNILAPRQTGKSSLMVRTIERLHRQGVRTAAVDLTEIGTELGADEWYFGLVTCLKEELELALDERAWWSARVEQGAVQRFSDFLRDIVLEEIAAPVVVFVDEIDSTLSLPFTDDFFAAIRSAYNARASDPAYNRLTFVLLGVVRPADLIKDRSRTPYNIGLSIDLRDFALDEARTLLPGLEAASAGRAATTLERVLYWTGGHPYLTQKVCAEIAATGDGQWSDERVDRLVQQLFQSQEARKESNLQFVRDRIHESRDREQLLRVYRKVLSGKEVADEERDPVKSELKLVGLLKATPRGTLTPRNRIYETIFDAQWVQEAMPKVTSIRVAIASALVAVIALIAGGVLLVRQQNKDQILARTYTEGFLGTQSPAVRISNLAGLFRLGDAFADGARELYFGLEQEQQLATFSELSAPEQVGEDLQRVIKGLYTHLEDSDAHNALLQAMVGDLQAIKAAFPDSSILCGELSAWLEGRTQARAGDGEKAVQAYGRAIDYGGQNPAIYVDRGLAYARLGQYDDALADLGRAVELDRDRQESVSELIRGNRPLSDYLKEHQDDFPALSAE